MGKAATTYERQRDMSVEQLQREAQKRDARVHANDDARLREQQAHALGIPVELRGENWNSSITGCLIFLCPYVEENKKKVKSLQNKYYQLHCDYMNIKRKGFAARGVIQRNGGTGSGIDHDEDSQAYIDKCQRDKDKWDGLEAHLQQLQNSMMHRVNVRSIETLMSDNDPPELWKRHTYQFKQLRIVLDSIDKFLGEKPPR